MMKKKILFSVALPLFCCVLLCAQPRALTSPKVIAKMDQPLRSPVWSPDGNKLAMTSMGNDGIWIVDKNGKNFQLLTSDNGVGYKMKWSADNTTILARTTVEQNHRVYNEVKAYNIQTKTESLILPQTRELKGMPYWSNDNSQAICKVGTEVKTSQTIVKANPLKNQADEQGAALLRQMLEEPLGIAERTPGLNQFIGKVIFNPALSAQGDRIAFQISGEGLFVCDANGANVKSLGEGENAAWTPDGNYIVVAQIEDDGKVITKSELITINVETGERSKVLSSDSYIALNPAVSPDGKKLAFEEYASGDIYIMDIDN